MILKAYAAFVDGTLYEPSIATAGEQVASLICKIGNIKCPGFIKEPFDIRPVWISTEPIGEGSDEL